MSESSDEYVSMTDLIKKGSKVKLLLRCNGLWVANGKFGCTWRAEQMKVSRAASFDDYAFDDSEEEEDDDCYSEAESLAASAPSVAGDGARHPYTLKIKEADAIKIPALTEPAGHRNWKVLAVQEISAASGRPDDKAKTEGRADEAARDSNHQEERQLP